MHEHNAMQTLGAHVYTQQARGRMPDVDAPSHASTFFSHLACTTTYVPAGADAPVLCITTYALHTCCSGSTQQVGCHISIRHLALQQRTRKQLQAYAQARQAHTTITVHTQPLHCWLQQAATDPGVGTTTNTVSNSHNRQQQRNTTQHHAARTSMAAPWHTRIHAATTSWHISQPTFLGSSEHSSAPQLTTLASTLVRAKRGPPEVWQDRLNVA